jgi:tetratricopeptide (TPR) repeat protein
LDALGELYVARGNLERADETYQKALRIALSTSGAMHPDTGVIYRNLAQLRISQKRLDEAAAFYDKELVIIEQGLGREHPIYGTYVAEDAVLMRKMKRKAEAKKLEVQARTIREHARGLMPGDGTVDVHALQSRGR